VKEGRRKCLIENLARRGDGFVASRGPGGLAPKVPAVLFGGLAL
jgi:hypothetical protein